VTKKLKTYKKDTCTAVPVAVEAHRLVRRRGSQMAKMLPASCPGRPLHPGEVLVLISVRGRVQHWAIMWLEGLGKLKNLVSSSRIKFKRPQLKHESKMRQLRKKKKHCSE
jgi:hypothetical protein